MRTGEVEKLTEIKEANIKFYEREGLINPRRNGNGYRDFSAEDVKRINQIKTLRMLEVPIQPGFPNNHTSIQESSNNYCYFWRASNGLTPRSRYNCSCFIRTSPCAGAFPGSR